MTRAVFVVAWIALVLPWQRCHSDCQDRALVSVVAEHECHTDYGARPCEDRHEEADHERADFDSLAPNAPAPIAEIEVADFEEPPARAGGTLVAPRVLERSPVARTTVLLL